MIHVLLSLLCTLSLYGQRTSIEVWYETFDEIFTFFSTVNFEKKKDIPVKKEKLFYGLEFCADEYIRPMQHMTVGQKIPAMMFLLQKLEPAFPGVRPLKAKLKKLLDLAKKKLYTEESLAVYNMLDDIHTMVELIAQIYNNSRIWAEPGFELDFNVFWRPAVQSCLLMTKIRRGVASKKSVEGLIRLLDDLIEAHSKSTLYRMAAMKIKELKANLQKRYLTSLSTD